MSGVAPQKAVDTLTKNLQSVSRLPQFENETQRLHQRSDFRKYAWQLTGPLSGFRGYFNRLAGYAHSGDTLAAVQKHCASQGVRFQLGERRGHVEKLTYDPSGRCVGVQTADGITHDGALVICALGANAASLIPKVGNFAVARCWSVVHIQLTEAEVNLLRHLPVINVRDLGFFFEADPASRLLKLCPLGAGYTNTGEHGISLPPANLSTAGWSGFVPREDERKLRKLLKETLPWLAERPFVDHKFCWFSDTADSEYCIDFIPGTGKSLVVLTGDSGHGFKMMPVVGNWVVELLNQGHQALSRWQWKSEDAGSKSGEGVSWRVGTSKEMQELLREQRTTFASRL